MINTNKLRTYASMSLELDTLREEYRGELERFNQEHIELLNAIDSKKTQIDELKTNLTTEALQEFQETNKKKLTGGLGIRELTKTEYDPERAMNWAKEHMMCLKLDTKAFEDIAKVQPIEFVTYRTQATVTFPAEIKLEPIEPTEEKCPTAESVENNLNLE